MAISIHLTDDQRLITIAAGLGFVAFVLAATVCLVQPTCLIHRRIWGKRERERSARIKAAQQMGIPIPMAVLSSKASTPDSSIPADLDKERTTFRETNFAFNRGAGVRDSTYSSMSSGSRCDTSIISDSIPEQSIQDESLVQGHITITVRFIPQLDQSNEKIIGQLGVNIKDAQDLPTRPYGGLCDPYAILQVVRDLRRMRKRKKGPSKVCELQTQTKRRTQCPLFNEGLLVPVTASDISDGGVLVKVFDSEKYSNHSSLGEALLPLKSYNLDRSEEHIISLDLRPSITNQGEVQIGLTYLPTSERLTLRIINFTNLRLLPQRDLNEFVVRSLLYRNGKLMKRMKTLPKTTSSTSPLFDESLTFDIPREEVDNVVFVVVLCLSPLIVSSPETPGEPEPAQSQRDSSQYLGKVIFGSEARGACQRQWLTMKNSPRREVIQWQALV